MVSPSAPAALGAEVRRALVDLPRQDATVAKAIATWDEELAGGFVPAEDREYASIGAIALEVFGPDALTMPEDDLACPAHRP